MQPFTYALEWPIARRKTSVSACPYARREQWLMPFGMCDTVRGLHCVWGINLDTLMVERTAILGLRASFGHRLCVRVTTQGGAIDGARDA